MMGIQAVFSRIIISFFEYVYIYIYRTGLLAIFEVGENKNVVVRFHISRTGNVPTRILMLKSRGAQDILVCV